MNTFTLLERAHVLLALVSGLGFALRGFTARVLERPLTHPAIRIGPHVLDTLLLGSGVALWVHFRHSPLDSGWFGLKLVLVVVYIALGIVAFRVEQRERAVLAYLAALLVFLGVATLAVLKPF